MHAWQELTAASLCACYRLVSCKVKQEACICQDVKRIYGLSAGLFDVSKEVARLNKQREKLEKDLAGIMGRVNNSKFMDKAPPKVVAETMQQKEDAEQKVSAIMQKIEQMSELARA